MLSIIAIPRRLRCRLLAPPRPPADKIFLLSGIVENILKILFSLLIMEFRPFLSFGFLSKYLKLLYF